MHPRPTPCPVGALVLRPGTRVVPMTGEHAVIYALANRGPVTCTVHGYPRVVRYGASGDVLPFHYATGGGAYVTSAKPVFDRTRVTDGSSALGALPCGTGHVASYVTRTGCQRTAAACSAAATR